MAKGQLDRAVGETDRLKQQVEDLSRDVEAWKLDSHTNKVRCANYEQYGDTARNMLSETYRKLNGLSVSASDPKDKIVFAALASELITSMNELKRITR